MKKFFISLIVVIVIIIVAINFYKKSTKIAPSNLQPTSEILTSIDISKAKYGKFKQNIFFTGTTSAINDTVISSQVSERVLKVLVDDGDDVKKGQLLAVLDDTDLKNNVLLQRAVLANAEENLKLNNSNLNRNLSLYKEGYLAKKDYDALVNAQISSQESVNEAKATLATDLNSLSHTKIIAPFDGTIYNSNINQGQLVVVGQAIFSLADLSHLRIQTPISNEQIDQILLNQEVIFNVGNSNRLYYAKVTKIIKVADPNTGSFNIFIDFFNGSYALKVGEFVSGVVVIKEIPHTAYIPNDTIRQDNDGTKYVYLIQNNVIVKKNITISATDNFNQLSAVVGIHADDLLLNDSIVTLNIGDHVNIIN